LNSYPYSWIIDSGASHQLEATKYFLSSLKTCMGPPILMGNESLVEISRQGRVDLGNGSFENFLHVPKLFINIIHVPNHTYRYK
jgi:hypothetical protein